MRIRPTRLGAASYTPVQRVTLAFPSTGTIAATTDLGISWATPSDHTQQLDSTKFNFTTGFSYSSLNAYSSISGNTYVDAGFGTAGTNPTLKYEFFLVNAAGADLYTLGSNTFDPTAAIDSAYFEQFGLFKIGAGTAGNGIRCQITITGTAMAVSIPAAWNFLAT